MSFVAVDGKKSGHALKAPNRCRVVSVLEVPEGDDETYDDDSLFTKKQAITTTAGAVLTNHDGAEYRESLGSI